MRNFQKCLGVIACFFLQAFGEDDPNARPEWYWLCKSESCLVVRGELLERDEFINLTVDVNGELARSKYQAYRLKWVKGAVFPVGFADYRFGDLVKFQNEGEMKCYARMDLIEGLWVQDFTPAKGRNYFVVGQERLGGKTYFTFIGCVQPVEERFLAELGIKLPPESSKSAPESEGSDR